MAHHLTQDHLSTAALRCQNRERNAVNTKTNGASPVVKSSAWLAEESTVEAAKRVKRHSHQTTSNRPSLPISRVTTAWQSPIAIKSQLVSRINNKMLSTKLPNSSRFSKALPNAISYVAGDSLYLPPLHRQLQRNSGRWRPQSRARMIISDLQL